MKQRFSSIDCKAIARELQSELGLRCSNIYDLSSKILLLKLAKSERKSQIVIDSGFSRTDFVRTTAPAPSPFVFRLRKFLKTRRLTSVRQIGTDRVLEFQFSDGQYRLYLEFFASGNVILTDSELKILALLRNVKEGEGQEPQRIGLTYSLENRQNFHGIPDFTKQRLRDALTQTVKKTAAAASTRRTSTKSSELSKGLATTITELPPIVVDHVFRTSNFDPTTKPADILANEDLFESLFAALKQARTILEDIDSSEVVKGYIIARPGKADDELPPVPTQSTATIKDFEPRSSKGLLYEDFQPFLPIKFTSDHSNIILTFAGFNKTVDQFFSSIEGQKLESRLTERELNAQRKLEATRQDHARRIEGLSSEEQLNFRKAATIEANVERVQEAMDAVIGLLEQGMDWVDISKLIEREQKRDNPVANIIKLPMDLVNNTITLRLGEIEDEDLDEGYETDSTVSDDDSSDDETAKNTGNQQQTSKQDLEVDIKLNLSPWSNAGEYYEQKRHVAGKKERTIEQSTVALKSAGDKISKDLKKTLKLEKPTIQPIRCQMWFEKYHWFISSDGYLVLGGRDAQTNELLYRRHLRRGDVYVHSEMHGAPSVIIKNNPRTPDAEIPPSTLSQAGQLAVCASIAWNSKAQMGAYWVNASQVSKAAPTGEYLPTGSFMVSDKRNELPPAPLAIGFGIMFRVSEESKARHAKQHRVYDYANDEIESAREPGSTTAAGHETPVLNIGDDDSDAGDDDDANSVRGNPLQDSAGREDGNASDEEEGGKPAPPTEKLAELQVSVPVDDESAENKDQAGGDADNPVHKDENEEPAEYASDDRTSVGASTPTTITGPAIPQQKKVPLKRGQRGKAKKIAQKYKDQTEEDRLAAEMLLGAAAGRLKREAEAKAKAEEAAAAEAARERRREQHRRQQREAAAHEEARVKQLAADDVGASTSGASEFATLETLVGTPLPGDEIVEAIPVCAPYAALARVKYKVKLQPGAQKKGKAIKEILEAWKAASTKKGVVDERAQDPEKMWPRELELIKALKPEEANNTVYVGKVKVMMSSGAAGGGGGGGGKGGGGKSGGGGSGGKGSKRR